MGQWRWTLLEEFKNGLKRNNIQVNNQCCVMLWNDVANTVEYMLESKK